MQFVIDIDPEKVIKKITLEFNSTTCDDFVQFFLDTLVDDMLNAIEAKYPDFSLDKAKIGPQLLEWCKNNPRTLPDSLKDKILEGIDHIKSSKPDKYSSTVDKLSQTIYNPAENSRFLDNEKHSSFVGSKRGENIYVYLQLDTEKLRQSITFSNNSILDPAVKAVHDAVISLYVQGNTHITYSMLYSALNGNNATRQPTAGFKKFANEAMTKLMYTGITIDAHEEAEAFGVADFQFKGYVLPMTYSLAIINGVTTECWKILEKPPLLSFAERKNQIATCDIKALDTGLNTTAENITLTHYLLDRVLIMKNQLERSLKSRHKDKIAVSNRILYQTVYEFLSVSAPNEATLRKKHQRIRQDIKTILDVWTNTGLIAGYTEKLDGRKFIGVDIKLIPAG